MSIEKDISILRKMCRDAEATDDLFCLAQGLRKALDDDYGDLTAVAVAANQVGSDIRMIIMRDEPRQPLYLVNPRVSTRRGHQVKA